ncbi:hypothetical protein PMIN01_02058 [Paraphaeosphaeria minitans]|uniref:Uncharacterized protein n=1 Tax=Paraphaeosphaeria minitans TaxID=565426 RepID=A0A9P6GPY2_9PLEO|nr:hypothetical protein PMIN01_02058 [Paraphaeosphaeria minitans]
MRGPLAVKDGYEGDNAGRCAASASLCAAACDGDDDDEDEDADGDAAGALDQGDEALWHRTSQTPPVQAQRLATPAPSTLTPWQPLPRRRMHFFSPAPPKDSRIHADLAGLTYALALRITTYQTRPRDDERASPCRGPRSPLRTPMSTARTKETDGRAWSVHPARSACFGDRCFDAPSTPHHEQW